MKHERIMKETTRRAPFRPQAAEPDSDPQTTAPQSPKTIIPAV
jgi:hypothetical protein